VKKKVNRNQMMGVRATHDFVSKFDGVCERLGHNRSEVIRYCLNKFINEQLTNPNSFERASSELY
jgi:metal-responsive CopG/Arc/MetJ family transcriptional regulator